MMTMQIRTTRICRSQPQRSSHQILRGDCNRWTHSSMRHTRRRGGQSSTYLQQPRSQNASLSLCSSCCCFFKFAAADGLAGDLGEPWVEQEVWGLVKKTSYSNTVQHNRLNICQSMIHVYIDKTRDLDLLLYFLTHAGEEIRR